MGKFRQCWQTETPTRLFGVQTVYTSISSFLSCSYYADKGNYFFILCKTVFWDFILSQFIYLLTFTKAWRRTLPIGGDSADNLQGSAESPGKCAVHRWRLLGSGMQKPERLQFSTRCFVYFSLHMEAGDSPLSVPVTHFQSPPYAHSEAGRGRWTQGTEEFSLSGSAIPALLCDGEFCGRLNIPIALTAHPCLG